MSGFYMKVKNVKIGAVSKAAYISRSEMYDETENHTYNYAKHEHDNTFSNVTLTENAPKEWKDPKVLWNEVQKAEQGKNTRRAREFIIALPQEMSKEQRESAIKEYQKFLAEKGMCSHAEIHEPDSKRSAAEIEKNYHSHILATQRLINEKGEFEKTKEKKVWANETATYTDKDGKERIKYLYNPDNPNDPEHRIPVIDDKTGEQKVDSRNRKQWHRATVENNPLNRAELVEECREKWAEICNKYLSEDQKIDHRSYERQGIERVAEVHEGLGAYNQHDERAAYNQQIRELNKQLDQAKKDAGEQIKEKEGEQRDDRTSENINRDNGRTEEAYRSAFDRERDVKDADRPTDEAKERLTERCDGLGEARREDNATRARDIHTAAESGTAEEDRGTDRGEQTVKRDSAGAGSLYKRDAERIGREQQGNKAGIRSDYQEQRNIKEGQRDDKEGIRAFRERNREKISSFGRRVTAKITNFRGRIEEFGNRVRSKAEEIRNDLRNKLAGSVPHIAESPMDKMKRAQERNASTGSTAERSEPMRANDLLNRAKKKNSEGC